MTATRPVSGTVFQHSTGQRSTGSFLTAIAATLALSISLAGCGSSPTSTHGGKVSGKGLVWDPKLGVFASPKVVSEGKRVPKGGGRVMVGKPYKIAGKRYVPRLDPSYKVVGMASWYGADFHGRRTANGEIFDANALTAAHPTMPLPSYARVTSLATGRSITVRVNDRGPFHSNRVLDMSRRTAEMLGVRSAGIAKVQVEYVGPAPVHGDDTRTLLASFRGPRDVAPASEGIGETLVASMTLLPGVLVSGLTGSSADDDEAPAPEAARPVVVADAAPVASVPLAPDATVDVASAEVLPSDGQAVRTVVLPPPRPPVIETYAVVASVDPAAILAPVQVATLEPAVLPPVQPAAFAEPPVAPDPVVATQPPMVFQVGPQPVPPQRSSYAEDRVSAAYAAVDTVGAGVGLSDLTRSLAEMAAPRAAAPSDAPVVQVGMFRDPDNARRIAAAFDRLGTVAVEDVTVNGKVLKRVRVSAATGVDVDDLIAAAARAGALGAVALR